MSGKAPLFIREIATDSPSLLDGTAEGARAERERLAAQTADDWLAEYASAFVYGEEARRLTPEQEGGK